jgi:hypothetical protein
MYIDENLALAMYPRWRTEDRGLGTETLDGIEGE